MTRKIVVANQKGGVGKTTTTLNLSRALTEQGYRVLMIDLDAQAGLTASVGIDPYTLKRSTYSLLMSPNIPVQEVMQKVGEGLYIVPAMNNLTAAEIRLAHHKTPTELLRKSLNNSQLDVDYVLLDTAPALGILSINGFVSADELLVPVQCSFLAMRGVRDTLDAMNQLKRRLNPNLHILGFLATMFDELNAPVSKEVVDELRNVFGNQVFQTVIGRASVLSEAPINAQSVLDYAPAHPAAFAYRALAQEVINRGK